MSSEISEDIKDLFLETLMDTPIMHTASKAVGVSPLAMQKLIDADQEFANDVEIAMQIGIGAAEGAAWERAVEGSKSYVYQNGKQVMTIDEKTGRSVPLVEYKFSDKLLELILKARKSEVYGDKAKLEVTGASVLVAPPTADLEGFRELLKQHRDGLENSE